MSFRCEHCGARHDFAPDACDACGRFGMVIPLVLEEEPAPQAPLLSVDAGDIARDAGRPLSTGSKAWDEALGGGLVPGFALILYGPPGSRKTTWAAAIADHIATKRRGRALYLSAEEPGFQVRDAVARIAKPKNLSIVGSELDACNLARCMDEVFRLRPVVVVYDSIQSFDAGGGMAGSEYAITNTVKAARRACAGLRHIAILISQVNKAGLPAGPYRTIHDCDVIARVSVDKIKITKNRRAPVREAVLSS